LFVEQRWYSVELLLYVAVRWRRDRGKRIASLYFLPVLESAPDRATIDAFDNPEDPRRESAQVRITLGGIRNGPAAPSCTKHGARGRAVNASGQRV
jgi:hypothetical protein